MANLMSFPLMAALTVTAALSAQAPTESSPIPPCVCHAQEPGLPPGPGAPRGGHVPMGGPMDGPAGMASVRFLDLSPAQARAVKELMDKHKPAMMERHKALMAKENALREAVEDPASSEAQLRTLAGVASAARLQVVLEQRAVVLELQALLTPEQQAKAERLRRKLQKERMAHEEVMEEIGEPRPGAGPGPGF